MIYILFWIILRKYFLLHFCKFCLYAIKRYKKKKFTWEAVENVNDILLHVFWYVYLWWWIWGSQRNESNIKISIIMHYSKKHSILDGPLDILENLWSIMNHDCVH